MIRFINICFSGAIAVLQDYQEINRLWQILASGITGRKTVDAIIAIFNIENNYSLLFPEKDVLPVVKYLGLIAVLAYG